MRTPLDVVLDTDIGGDIDDTWALAMALMCPELALRLVTSATGDTEYRARLAARVLDVAGRAGIPVGVGIPGLSDGPREAQKDWIRDYPLTAYPGRVRSDGVESMAETLVNGHRALTLVAIGPLTNVAVMVRRYPHVAARTRLVCMLGSIRKEHFGRDGAIAEWNVAQDIPSAQEVFRAPWREMVITPLDTCGVVQLQGERYRRLLAGNTPIPRIVMENYRLWNRCRGRPPELADRESTLLYDTVAVHLAYSTRFLRMETMPLVVTDDGFTRIDPRGRNANVVTEWEDLEGFLDDLVNRLLAPAFG